MSAAQARFDRGLTELGSYFLQARDDAILAAVAAFRSATALAPGEASYWTALGFALDTAGELEEAIAALEKARALDREDEDVELLLVTLISESGAEGKAMAALEDIARRQGVDLDVLRGDLTDAGMPTDAGTLLRNGFPHPRNFLRSRLEDEIEQSRLRQSGEERPAEGGVPQLPECREMQEVVRLEVNAARVPRAVLPLTPWAVRLGIGDDVCRGRLAEELSHRERTELVRAVDRHAEHVNAWLDEFSNTPMTPEAAAFMYLLLAVEELEQGS